MLSSWCSGSAPMPRIVGLHALRDRLFRPRLDQIIDMKHALVKLGQVIDWRFWKSETGSTRASYRPWAANPYCCIIQ
jgi:hypothetical protein